MTFSIWNCSTTLSPRRRLAEAALKLRPNLKVLYTTGYTRNAVVHNGVLDPDVNFIAKPFTVDQLGQKIREVLS